MIIRLPAQPHESLDWKIEPTSEKITWEFDLGIEAPYFPLEDELRFQALALALTQFTKEVWPRFQEQTEGAVLYRGPIDFNAFFSWTHVQETNYALWRQERPQAPELHLRRLFCAEAFVTYFQRLAHKLPDELPLILDLKLEGFSSQAELFHLLSPERFAHFQIRPPLPQPSLGVCFPEEWDGTVLREIDAFLEGRPAMRPVFEATLTEQWDGLDVLYVGRISEKGQRKLNGFIAAGGTVKKIGAEGFEPPTYWSQTSRASQAALCPVNKED